MWAFSHELHCSERRGAISPLDKCHTSGHPRHMIHITKSAGSGAARSPSLCHHPASSPPRNTQDFLQKGKNKKASRIKSSICQQLREWRFHGSYKSLYNAKIHRKAQEGNRKIPLPRGNPQSSPQPSPMESRKPFFTISSQRRVSTSSSCIPMLKGCSPPLQASVILLQSADYKKSFLPFLVISLVYVHHKVNRPAGSKWVGSIQSPR